MSQSKARAALRSTTAVAAVSGLLILAGCAEDGTSLLVPAGKSDTRTAEKSAPEARTKKAAETDVPAPEVFQAAEAGLWDGRPSLGGIWVAHPDVTEPQRVLVRNEANGREVTGALFRRQRDVPGPRIQASSDAAEALGMLAGAPVKLNVTALVRDQVETTPVEDPLPAAEEEREAIAVSRAEPSVIETPLPRQEEEEIVPLLAQSTIEEDVADPAVTVLAAEEPVPQPKSRMRWPWQKKPSIEDTILSDDPVEDASLDTRTADVTPIESVEIEQVELVRASDTPIAEDPTQPETFSPRHVTTNNADIERPELSVRDQDRRIAAAVSVVLSEPPRPDLPIPGASPQPEPAAIQTDEAEILRETLRQQDESAVAIPPVLQDPRPREDAGQITETPFPNADAELFVQKTADVPDASDLERPYIQVGVFGVEDNAARTAQNMRTAGIVPRVLPTKSSGKPAWRVVVGPARSTEEQSQLMQKIRDTGFKDAYTVTN